MEEYKILLHMNMKQTFSVIDHRLCTQGNKWQKIQQYLRFCLSKCAKYVHTNCCPRAMVGAPSLSKKLTSVSEIQLSWEQPLTLAPLIFPLVKGCPMSAKISTVWSYNFSLDLDKIQTSSPMSSNVGLSFMYCAKSIKILKNWRVDFDGFAVVRINE